MALSTSMVFEFRANGTSNGGGGFVTGASGTDYSQQDSVQIARTDLVIDATTDTDITSAATPFTTAEVGNLINITAGTGFTVARYEITAVAAGVCTLDSAVGTLGSTGGSGSMGGAMTLNDYNITPVSLNGQIAYIANDATHTLTAAIALNTTTTSGKILVEGYNTTRGDSPTGSSRPLVAAGAYAVDIESQFLWVNFRFTGTSTAIVGTSSSRRGGLYNVSINNSSGTASRDAFDVPTGSNYIAAHCELQSVNGFAVVAGGDTHLYGCYIHDSDVGVLGNSSYTMSMSHCIIDTCSEGVGSDTADLYASITNTTIYNCTKGVDLDEWEGIFMDNIIDSCTTGFEVDAVSFGIIDYNNWSNNTADISVASKGANATSGAPGFADAPNGNFAPGAGVKATSSLGAFPGGLTTGYLDQGAVQHQDTGGGGTIARFSAS